MASIHCSSVRSTSPGHNSSTICAMPFRMQILNETVYLGLNFLSWNSKSMYDPVTSCEFQIMICFDYVLQIYSLHPSLRVSNFQKFESATRAHGVHPIDMLIQFECLEESDLFRSGVVYFVQLQFQIFISQPRTVTQQHTTKLLG